MSMNVTDLVVAFQEAKIAEAYGDPVDVTEFLRDSPGFSFSTGSTFSKSMQSTQIYDRSDGRYRPVYEHEQDLKIIRAMSWLLYDRVPMAKAWCLRLQDYTIGTGFDWSIASDDKPLAELCNGIVDRVLLDNHWDSVLERESYEREVVDGEFLAVLHQSHPSSCEIEIEVRECDELTQPAHTRQLEDWIGCAHEYESSWTFGVHTRKNRSDRPIGYHLVRDPAGNDWDYVPVEKAVHWKRNVRAKAKRGFSDFYTPHVYIARGDRVFTNTAEGAAIQAAIAYIVEHAPSTTSAQAAAITSANLLATGRVNPATGVSERTTKIQPGTRLDVRNGQRYHNGPIGAVNNQIYIQVMSAALRLAGTVKAFPEGMLNGDYSNNNLASALVAQSPFVQGRISEQFERGARFRELIAKILGLVCNTGRFRKWKIASIDDLLGRITINVIPPKVVPMERLQLAQALMIEKQNGWVSDRTAMQELGRDADVEMANGAKATTAAPNIVLGGSGQPAPSNPANGPDGSGAGNTGEYMGLSRQQWQRNRKAIEDTLAGLADGSMTRGAAEAYLMMLGLSSVSIEKLLADASDGKVDSELPESFAGGAAGSGGCGRWINYP